MSWRAGQDISGKPGVVPRLWVNCGLEGLPFQCGVRARKVVAYAPHLPGAKGKDRCAGVERVGLGKAGHRILHGVQ